MPHPFQEEFTLFQMLAEDAEQYLCGQTEPQDLTDYHAVLFRFKSRAQRSSDCCGPGRTSRGGPSSNDEGRSIFREVDAREPAILRCSAMQVLYEGAGLYEQRAAHRLRSLSWRDRAILLWGKVRRFYLVHFRPQYVEASLARRVGECHRTGACCNVLFSCPLLSWVKRMPACGIYLRRPKNCTTFPIDERDLRDRNIVNPWEPCGFSFLEDRIELTGV